MDRYPITGRSLEWFFDIDGDLFERQYNRHLSGYWQWKDTAEGVHAEQWRVFPQNIGPHLSIDETSLSRGELYTIVTNKEAHGREDSIVAIVLVTDADTVIHALRQIKSELRNTVKEITLDLSDSMHRICRMAFPRASRVIDRFHVQRLALDAVQEIHETGPHAHCVFVPLTADGRLCSKEVLGGKNKNEARQHMRNLHTRLAEVNRKYGLDRGDDIHETGARHRSTAEYNHDLHRENAKLETLINDNREQLRQLEDEIRKSERRVKGLTTMIANLERQEAELNDEKARLESDIENGAGDVSELRRRIAELENQLESTGQKLADKRDKLRLADRQLVELQDELHVVKEKRDSAQKNFHEFTEKNQEQIRMRLTDAVFARMVVDVRSMIESMPPEQKADLDGEFLTAIAKQPNEILKCAMYLFLGYLDGATQFAQSCGGGGTSSDLPWGRNPDEDDRRFAYRCMMQAHKMMKPSQPKRGIGGKR